jgi:MinD superfamily P-loop ATPase
MHLLLEPDRARTEDFYSGELACIRQDACIACGKCAEVCRFDAVEVRDGVYTIKDIDCEGCGYCARVCPAGAIDMKPRNVGTWHVSGTRLGCTMVHARLGIGAENSGKLVAKVKNEAKRAAEETGKRIVLVDGSPGIGCPVVSSLSGADFVVLVTEPTVSGLHDLRRVHELVRKFKIPGGCIVNKADLNEEMTREIVDFLRKEKILLLSRLPYDESFTDAMVAGKTIVEFSPGPLEKALREAWRLLAGTVEKITPQQEREIKT